MDSLTQIALGAAVGEALAGKKIGWRAAAWGAVAGTIPDLDVLANPFLDVVEELSFHRSVTHSVLFSLLAPLLFAWLHLQWQKHRKMTFKDWYLLYFLGFFTHILLDTFTTWGTQLGWPFTTYGYALYSIFVVDFLYTLPLLAGVVWALFLPRLHPKREFINALGLVLSSAYLLWANINQQVAENVFRANLREQQIAYSDAIVKTTPLNIFLWTVSAKTPDGFYTGFYSLFDADDKVNLQFVPGNQQLLDRLPQTEKLQRLKNITKGYYAVEAADATLAGAAQVRADAKRLVMYDLRFGTFDGWQGEAASKYVFSYIISPQPDNTLIFEQEQLRFVPTTEYLKAFFGRVLGEK
jgi:inner membrane protein